MSDPSSPTLAATFPGDPTQAVDVLGGYAYVTGGTSLRIVNVWKPTVYVDIWRAIMFSYEFPLEAAQTAIYAHELTGSPVALDAAQKWAINIRSLNSALGGFGSKTSLGQCLSVHAAVEQGIRPVDISDSAVFSEA